MVDAAVVAVLVAAVGCGLGGSPGPVNVVFFAIDTLRADHLGAAGAEYRVRLVPTKGSFGQVTLSSLTADDAPIARDQIVLGRVTAPPETRLPMIVTSADTLVATVGMPEVPSDGGLRVAVQTVLGSRAPKALFDPATAEHLRALGYAE